LIAIALLGALTIRPRAKVPEPEPTPREVTPLPTRQQSLETAAQPGAVPVSMTLPITPASSPPRQEELRHPHPITPEHERIYRENELTFALDGAVDIEDVSGIRRLLAIYRSEYPEDSLVMQQGYEIIADCLAQPGERTRAAAQRFYDTEFASSLRRHVRRHCLERPQQ